MTWILRVLGHAVGSSKTADLCSLGFQVAVTLTQLGSGLSERRLGVFLGCSSMGTPPSVVTLMPWMEDTGLPKWPSRNKFT